MQRYVIGASLWDDIRRGWSDVHEAARPYAEAAADNIPILKPFIEAGDAVEKFATGGPPEKKEKKNAPASAPSGGPKAAPVPGSSPSRTPRLTEARGRRVSFVPGRQMPFVPSREVSPQQQQQPTAAEPSRKHSIPWYAYLAVPVIGFGLYKVTR